MQLFVHTLVPPRTSIETSASLTCDVPFMVVAAGLLYSAAPYQPVYPCKGPYDATLVNSGLGISAAGFEGLAYTSLAPAASEVAFRVFTTATVLYVATASATPPNYTVNIRNIPN